MELLKEVLDFAVGNENKQCMVILPVANMYQDAIKEYLLSKNIGYEFRATEGAYTLNNGTRIWTVSSSNPERLRGCRIDFCVIMHPDTIRNINYLEHSILYPATVSTNGVIKKNPNKLTTHQE